jgi:monofunctional biosynthetic peptidoglycan transglycosylase
MKLLPHRFRYRLELWSLRRRVYPRRRRGGLLRRGLMVLLLAVSGTMAASVGLTLALRWVDPPVTAWMVWNARATDRPVAYRWVDAEDISPEVAIAVVAAEDQKFPAHSGFDVDSILEAAREHIQGTRTRGASTISQQVAKNLFLWPERSLVRKGLEAWFTVWIELLWPKERILEVYLNVAEFGPGVFGVGAASDLYFDGPARAIDRRRAALLAAVLPNPVRLHVDRPSPYVLARRDWIQGQVRMLGGPAYLRP